MKIAVTGKGGVGKTTIAAALALYFSDNNYRVIVVDADPDANLAAALGIPEEDYANIKPIAEMKELVEQRTGVRQGTMGGFFNMSPDVSDIPERFSYKFENIHFLALGTIEKGGAGCICPEGALVKALIRHLVLAEKDVVIMDMEAGVEHLGRGIAQSVDAFIIVIEPGLRSIQTAEKIKRLASDIGIDNIFAVLNKASDSRQIGKIKDKLGNSMPVIEEFGEYKKVRDSDLKAVSAYRVDSEFAGKVGNLAKYLENRVRSIVKS